MCFSLSYTGNQVLGGLSVDLNALLVAMWVFTARTIDVSMGTVRQIMIIRGQRKIAASIGFFEIMIWATAISFVVTQINQIQYVIALGLGFAAGNYLGCVIEEKIALGYMLAYVVPKNRSAKLERDFRVAGFGVTTVMGSGLEGPKPIYHIVFRRKDTRGFLSILRRHDPKAFYTLVDVRSEKGGYIRGTTAKKK